MMETKHKKCWRQLMLHSSACLVAFTMAVIVLCCVPFAARAEGEVCSALDVAGEQVTICRDDFGRPRIFAETNRGLFVAYGYVVAEDRLAQMELNRRVARGRLSEILGPLTLDSDRYVHTVGYSDEELTQLFNGLSSEEQEIFRAYADGINRYITEVIVPDPLNKLPFEFHVLGIRVPEPWTVLDSTAFGAYMVRRFGEIGGSERSNQALLNSLVTRHGQEQGLAIFNDVRWINDPDAPVTVPPEESGQRQTRGTSNQTSLLSLSQLQGASEDPADLRERARRIWERLGVVHKLGSYAWVVGSNHSAEGAPLLYGGPQMGFSAPEVVHEVQLTGGTGFNVTGMAFAGVPAVLIGRNENIAWTSTTATGDNVDVYSETLCDGGNGYQFEGACRPFQRRVVTIRVRDAEPVQLTVLRSVHGPVVGTSGGVAFTEKRAHWLREMESAHAFFLFDRAQNLEEFQAGAMAVVTSHNFLYADRQGNIAYWQAGQVPIRPEGYDPRLPLPGDGRAEWPGGTLDVPTSINPARGWLTNWNNKPSVDYDNGDEQNFGKQFRILDIEDRLRTGPISLEDMRDIPKDIARVGGLGREARFLLPYLLAGLDAVPPSHPLAAQARTVLENWDGSAIEDAVTSTRYQAGEVIFSEWLGRMRTNTFRTDLGDRVGDASTNMLIHVLDDALGEGSGVPPSRDYFHGADPNRVMSTTFDEALNALGPDPAAWSNRARPDINITHPLVGRVGTIPLSNRSTYGQIVVLSNPEAYGENIFTMGQSGFIRLVPPGDFEFDPHFRDQLDLFRAFEYKPMPLVPRP